jgi:hypothetical protein
MMISGALRNFGNEEVVVAKRSHAKIELDS